MTEVFTRRMSRWQAEQQREDVADVYVEAYHGPAGEEFSHRQDFLRRFADDVRRPGFDMVVASERRMTGAAYGFRLDRADGWWREFAGDPPAPLEELTASGQVFALAQLMVLPSYRRQGIAARLVNQLLLRSDAALATALVRPSSDDGFGSSDSTAATAAAAAALSAWGWTRIGELGPGRGPAAIQVWSRALPR